MSQGKGFLPVYVQEPHFIVGFGTRRIVCIRFRAEPSCPHFISEAGVQCAASRIDAVKEAYFHGGGVHGLYGDFHIVDEVVGVSLVRLMSQPYFSFLVRPMTWLKVNLVMRVFPLLMKS